jgi:hypothetical protein
MYIIILTRKSSGDLKWAIIKRVPKKCIYIYMTMLQDFVYYFYLDE